MHFTRSRRHLPLAVLELALDLFRKLQHGDMTEGFETLIEGVNQAPPSFGAMGGGPDEKKQADSSSSTSGGDEQSSSSSTSSSLVRAKGGTSFQATQESPARTGGRGAAVTDPNENAGSEVAVATDEASQEVSTLRPLPLARSPAQASLSLVRQARIFEIKKEHELALGFYKRAIEVR